MSRSGHSDNNHGKTEGLNNNGLTACDIKLDKPGNNTIDPGPETDNYSFQS